MYASEFFVFGLGLIFCFNLCFGCEDAAKSLCVVEFINCIETASEKDQICTCFGHEYGCMKKIHCDVAAFPTTCKNAGCTFVQCNPLSAISPALENAVKKTSNAIQWKKYLDVIHWSIRWHFDILLLEKKKDSSHDFKSAEKI